MKTEKWIKRFFMYFLLWMITFALKQTIFATELIKVQVNEEEVLFDQSPVIIDGRTLVPIRAVCERLGADVYWDESSEMVGIIKNRIKLLFSVDNDQFFAFNTENFTAMITETDFDYSILELDVPPQLTNGRVMVPIRDICVLLGATVEWDAESKTIEITCPAEIVQDQNRDKTFFEEWATMMIQQQQNTDIKIEDRYLEFPYVAVITVSDFENDFQYSKAQQIILARADWVFDQENDWEKNERRPYYTMDLSHDGKIVVIFGYEEDFDIDDFTNKILQPADFYFSDEKGAVIVDKTDILWARSVWKSETQAYNVEIELTEEGQKKLEEARVTSTTSENERISMYLDGTLLSEPYKIKKIEDNIVVLSGFVNIGASEGFVTMITMDALSERLQVDLDIEVQ